MTACLSVLGFKVISERVLIGDSPPSKVGLTRPQVDAVVNQLLVISLRGVDTHGIALAERYIEGIKTGQINKRPRPKIVRQSPLTAVIDGDRGLGAYLATTATRMAIKKAKRSGIGAVSLINLTHCGALSYHGLLIAEQKMAGIAFTNSSRQAAPWGGATPIFGTTNGRALLEKRVLR